jgi:hypothetical protein
VSGCNRQWKSLVWWKDVLDHDGRRLAARLRSHVTLGDQQTWTAAGFTIGCVHTRNTQPLANLAGHVLQQASAADGHPAIACKIASTSSTEVRAEIGNLGRSADQGKLHQDALEKAHRLWILGVQPLMRNVCRLPQPHPQGSSSRRRCERARFRRALSSRRAC